LKGTVGRLSLETYRNVLIDLSMGYTSLRSLSSPAYVDIAVRDIIESGILPGPRLRVSGQGLTATGGHMDKPWWSPDLSVPGRTGVCDGPWEARKAARTQLKWGADVLKINPCVGDYRNLSTPWRQEMTFDEISAICEEAHWAGKTVAAHTSGGQGITDSLRAGVDSLEHAHWLSDEQIEMMVKAGTFYVPTLIVNTRSIELGADEKGISADGWNWLKKVYDDKWETLRRAKDAGVRIAAGTDAGFVVPHGENALEILELVKGGFTVMEALVAATQTAADCLGIGDEVGSIQEGKRADFVLVQGNVLANPEILLDQLNIVAVYKDGVKMATAL
jgi:imidazolonepropionase-like amidohydrolase